MSYISNEIDVVEYVIGDGTVGSRYLILDKRSGGFIKIPLDYDTAADRNSAIETVINNLINGAPGSLNTLYALAAALGNDPDFSITIATSLSARPQWKGAFTPDVDYTHNDLVTHSGGLYIAPVDFTAGSLFDIANWIVLVPELGTFLGSSDNLSDLTNLADARANLGLGTAAVHPATDFDTPAARATAITSAINAASGIVLDARDTLTDLTGAINAIDQASMVQTLIAESETAGKARTVQLPSGNVYLNSEIYFNAADVLQNYIFKGHGHGTTLILGPGLNGKFAFNSNYLPGGGNATASIYKQPHIIFDGIDVDGTLAISGGVGASLIRSYKGSVKVINFRCLNVDVGIDVDGYTDRNTFEDGYWNSDRSVLPNSWFYKQHTNGDTSTCRKVIFSSNSGGVWVTSAEGFSLVDCIKGRHRFTRCNAVRVVDAHEDSAGELTAMFLIEDSQVTFESGWTHSSSTGVPWITINDDTGTLTRPGSQVTIRDSALGYRVDSANEPRAPYVYLQNFQPKSRLRIEQNNAPFGYQNGTANYDYGVGSTIVAADAAIQAAIDAFPELFLSGGELRYINSAWEVVPLSAGIKPSRFINTPTLGVAPSALLFGTLVAGTTYYYRVATKGRRSTFSTKSLEDSGNASGTSLAMVLTVSPRYAPAICRVWRGTAPDTYDRYVDIPLDSTSTRLFDQGTKVSGYDWILVSVPAVPTGNSTLDGLVVPGNHGIFYGTAIPTLGTYLVGDVIINTGATGPFGWRCTVGGTPGTWQLIGAVATTLREDAFRRSGAYGETLVRPNVATQTISLTSGTLQLYALPIVGGVTINHITFYTGTTAGAALTHVWVALFDLNRVCLGLSADDVSGALAANSILTYNLTAPVVTGYDGLYYVGILVAGTTMPTLSGQTGLSGIVSQTPRLNGRADAGLTTPPALPFTAASLTAQNSMAYFDVS